MGRYAFWRIVELEYKISREFSKCQTSSFTLSVSKWKYKAGTTVFAWVAEEHQLEQENFVWTTGTLKTLHIHRPTMLKLASFYLVVTDRSWLTDADPFQFSTSITRHNVKLFFANPQQ